MAHKESVHESPKCCEMPILDFLKFQTDCKICDFYHKGICIYNLQVPTYGCQICQCINCGKKHVIQSLDINDIEEYEEIYGSF